MKYFSIKRPYTSAGLRMTYNKQVEIYEYDSDTKTGILHYQTAKTKKWKTKVMSIRNTNLTTIANVINGKVWSNFLSFSTYQEAYLAKFYLLDQMKKDYLVELAFLQKRMEANCPDVSAEVDELRQQYPEYFI